MWPKPVTQEGILIDVTVFLLCLCIALAKVLHFGCMTFPGKNSFVICFRSHGTYGNNRMNRQSFHFKLSSKHNLRFDIHLSQTFETNASCRGTISCTELLLPLRHRFCSLKYSLQKYSRNTRLIQQEFTAETLKFFDHWSKECSLQTLTSLCITDNFPSCFCNNLTHPTLQWKPVQVSH